jgi:hypothetical protein
MTTYLDNERNTRFFSGPEVKEIRKATGRDFNPVAIREKENAGQTIRGERMEIYRPKVDGRAVRVEKTEPAERYSPTPEKARRSITPEKYKLKTAERQVQGHMNTRNESLFNKNENPKRQPSHRQSFNPASAHKEKN